MPRLEPLGPTWPPRVHCWKWPRPRPQEWWYDIGQSVRWSDALRSGTFGDDFWMIVDDGMMVFHLGEDLNLQLLKGGWIFRILGKTFKKLGEKHEFGKNMNSTHENHESSSVNIFARPMIGCSLWLEISVFGHAKQSHQCFAKSDWLNQSAYKTKQKTHHHVGKKLFLSQPLITSTSLTFILVHFKTHKNMCIQ